MTATKGSKRSKAESGRRKVARSSADKERIAPQDPVRPAPQIQLVAAALILVSGFWAYQKTLADLVHTWSNQPDYSHGFLVVPVAIYFLWLRRDTFPGLSGGNLWLVLPFFATSVFLRWVDGRYFMHFLDGWSIVFWAASLAASLGGWSLLRWSFPAVGFLVFMIPLPFSLENTLSLPLQRLAAKLSTWSLQTMALPAFSQGNVILLGEERLDVAQACSGLRLFMSMMALAYVFIVVVKRAWWEKALLVAALVPIAIVSNSARVVATGLLYQLTNDAGVRKHAHDFAGLGMILFAAALFGIVLWYLKLLVREEEVMDAAALARRA